jgi:hypothetical protein
MRLDTFDITRLLEIESHNALPETRWRWALLDIAADTLQVIQQQDASENGTIWRDEARWRAARILQLALIDSHSPVHVNVLDGKWDYQSAINLARCYHSLHQNDSTTLLDCKHLLRETLVGLVAAYRPIAPKFEIEFGLNPITLAADQRRGLILFASCIIHGLLERARARGCGGKTHMSLQADTKSTVRLRVQTLDPAELVMSTPSHEIASRLAASLGGELVCSQGPGRGSILNLQFSKITSHAQCHFAQRPTYQGTTSR